FTDGALSTRRVTTDNHDLCTTASQFDARLESDTIGRSGDESRLTSNIPSHCKHCRRGHDRKIQVRGEIPGLTRELISPAQTWNSPSGPVFSDNRPPLRG